MKATQALSSKKHALLPLAMAALFAALFSVMLAGCVAANGPSSSDESKDSDKAASSAAAFTEETAKSTETERASVPTHITMTADGVTRDTRLEIGDNGKIASAIDTLTRDGATSESSISYDYDAEGNRIGGTQAFDGLNYSFTTTIDVTTDDSNVSYTQTNTYDTPVADLYGEGTELKESENTYVVNDQGAIVTLITKCTYSYNGKDCVDGDELTFDEEGHLTLKAVESDPNGIQLFGPTSQTTLEYSDDYRACTETTQITGSGTETFEYELAYDEIGQLIRASITGATNADGATESSNEEATVEYYESPVTAMAKIILSVQPQCLIF